MIEETAVITRIERGRVWIKASQSSACGACLQQSSCGTATLSHWLPKREFAVDCDRALNIGDRVTVAIDDSHLLLGSLLIYGLPLLLTLSAVGLANLILPIPLTERWLPELGLSVLLLTFWVIHRWQNILFVKFRFRLQIVAVL